MIMLHVYVSMCIVHNAQDRHKWHTVSFAHVFEKNTKYVHVFIGAEVGGPLIMGSEPFCQARFSCCYLCLRQNVSDCLIFIDKFESNFNVMHIDAYCIRSITRRREVCDWTLKTGTKIPSRYMMLVPQFFHVLPNIMMLLQFHNNILL